MVYFIVKSTKALTFKKFIFQRRSPPHCVTFKKLFHLFYSFQILYQSRLQKPILFSMFNCRCRINCFSFGYIHANLVNSLQLRRPPTPTRSRSTSSFRSPLSKYKRRTTLLGALVAVVPSFRYIYTPLYKKDIKQN